MTEEQRAQVRQANQDRYQQQQEARIINQRVPVQPSNVNPHLDPRLFDIANLPQAIQAEPSGVNNRLERPPIEVDGDILEPHAVRPT